MQSRELDYSAGAFGRTPLSLQDQENPGYQPTGSGSHDGSPAIKNRVLCSGYEHRQIRVVWIIINRHFFPRRIILIEPCQGFRFRELWGIGEVDPRAGPRDALHSVAVANGRAEVNRSARLMVGWLACLQRSIANHSRSRRPPDAAIPIITYRQKTE